MTLTITAKLVTLMQTTSVSIDRFGVSAYIINVSGGSLRLIEKLKFKKARSKT